MRADLLEFMMPARGTPGASGSRGPDTRADETFAAEIAAQESALASMQKTGPGSSNIYGMFEDLAEDLARQAENDLAQLAANLDADAPLGGNKRKREGEYKVGFPIFKIPIEEWHKETSKVGGRETEWRIPPCYRGRGVTREPNGDRGRWHAIRNPNMLLSPAQLAALFLTLVAAQETSPANNKKKQKLKDMVRCCRCQPQRRTLYSRFDACDC